ncbi:MAG: hypothetical protein CMJ64_12365 [Planctomycetaceae bacterium]|nr:hypothetical protein [Planctomycetaceae bacterium]
MPQRTKNFLPQFSLQAFFELTSGSALLIAAFLQDSLFVNWLVFAFFMVWVVRVRDLPLRWSLMSCFGGCAAVFFGLMCLQLAFENATDLGRRSRFEYLAFLGPMVSGCGLGMALIGMTLAFRCLVGLRVTSDTRYSDGQG